MTRARCTLLAASLALACTPSTWDVARLEASHRALAAIGGHRLGDATPYLLPRQGRLLLFLCRWPSDAPIAVSLPPTASEQERGDLRRVLRAMEAAGLGVRFEVSTAKPAGIAIRFAEVEAGTRAPIRAADTVADCGLARTLPDASVRVLPARIVHASIVLERGGRDNLGRPLAHTREEFVGGALHELGHALGFQGHARRGDTVMDRSVDEVRRAGRRLLEKGAFRDDTLRALYAVPSGTVVRRISLTPAQTRPVDRLFEIAERRDLVGPLLRVGDRDGRIAWFAAHGPPIALMVFDVDRALRNPATLAVVPTGPARRLLEEES